ncbi:hypothetical protein ABBQ38_010042 [Trebouxia sp. C0009 RCD-2024]
MPCVAAQMRASLCRLSAHSAAAPQPQPQPSECLRPSLRRRQAVHCQAAGKTLSSNSQQGAALGVQVEREEVPHYAQGSEYLKSLGFRNASEISRVLDIAMNPNSLYLQDRHKRRSVNSSARRLSVQDDMQPVCHFLQSQGLSEQEVVEVVSKHPPVLSYSVDNRLQPFMSYMKEIGIAEPAKAILQRPTLLGLDADKNLKAIVGYLQDNGHSTEDICHLLQTSI